MPLTTRNTKKKAPAKAKATAKSKSGSGNGKATKGASHSRKRAATESDSDSESTSEEEPTAKKTQSRKKARAAKRAKRNESDDDIEVVEEGIPAPAEPEVVTDEELDASSANENEVNKKKMSPYKINSQVFKKDGLNEHQRGTILQEKPVKKDSTLDILTVMSDRVTVNFKNGDKKTVTEKGRWCNLCR
jgi:hypothetical protein